MKSFEKFARQVADAGLEAKDHGQGHWQIRGGNFTVNYYPATRTIYINGTHSTKHTRQTGGWDAAVKAAKRIPPRRQKGHKVNRYDRARNRTIRARLMEKHPYCHWCNKLLSYANDDPDDRPTLEHIIPLDRGGSNGPDNLTLACGACNDARGHNMPELQGGNGGKKEERETPEAAGPEA